MSSLALALVLINANVVTEAPAHPHASVVALAGERITYVGDDVSQARTAAGASAEVIDLEGKTMVPGFNDAHVHFGMSITLGGDGAFDFHDDSRADFLRSLEKAAAERPGSTWLFIKTERIPDKLKERDLDAFARPIFVVSGHGGQLNHLAIERGGFTLAEAPQGFIRGRALAAAIDRVVKHLPADTLRLRAIEFLRKLSSYGITSVQLIDELPELFESLRREGLLTARVRMIPLGYRFETKEYTSRWNGPAPEWLRVDGVKYFHDDWARMSKAEVREIFTHTIEASRKVVVHILSRHALSSFLDMLEPLFRVHPEASKLFRFDHVDEVRFDDYQRLKKMGIIVCSNPSMLPEWRDPVAFPMRSLANAGIRTCIGTDWVGTHIPPRTLSPIESMALAVTHGGFGDQETVSPEAALEAYTVGSATAEGEELEKGSIQKGKLGDLVVLSQDPRTVPAKEIEKTRVLLTVVGGKIVFRDGPFASETGGPTIGKPIKPPPTTIRPAEVPGSDSKARKK